MSLFGKKKNKPEREEKKEKAGHEGDLPGGGLVMPGSGKDGKKQKSKRKKLKDDTKNAYKILLEPVISEKGTVLAEDGKYLFRVVKNATKSQIGEAIHNVYGIRPEKVNVMNIRGKSRRQGRSTGRTSDWKKAVVTLPEGKKIEVYEGV
ncbi:MAG: 50S ribosomal protein L23 [uncultured bacterium]|nr:MAG: 50S ribosomal protein L23 [uncultured bacterium]